MPLNEGNGLSICVVGVDKFAGRIIISFNRTSRRLTWLSQTRAKCFPDVPLNLSVDDLLDVGVD